MTETQVIERLDYVIGLGTKGLENKIKYAYSYQIPHSHFGPFRAAGLSVIIDIFDAQHPYSKQFSVQVANVSEECILVGLSILESIKHEVSRGWLTTMRSSITAEVFSDFLEMGKYFLDEGYKDAAAVMIGSVLEEHLRGLCSRNNIPITNTKEDKEIPKKASLINDELRKADIYNSLDHKSVTSLLDLRNSAAHGKYGEYKIEQVQLMYQAVLNFVNRTN
jgi:hypothetical protein